MSTFNKYKESILYKKQNDGFKLPYLSQKLPNTAQVEASSPIYVSNALKNLQMTIKNNGSRHIEKLAHKS